MDAQAGHGRPLANSQMGGGGGLRRQKLCARVVRRRTSLSEARVSGSLPPKSAFSTAYLGPSATLLVASVIIADTARLEFPAYAAAHALCR